MLTFPISVFIDTNVFVGFRYNLIDSDLKHLINYVNQGKIRLFLSSIVVNETKANISKDISKLHESLKKLINENKKLISPKILQGSEIFNILTNHNYELDYQFAYKNFDDFLTKADVQLLDLSSVSLESVLSDYFNCVPPFQDKKDKKNEFPDAIMSMQIKNEFTGRNTLHVVSGDKGFLESLKTEESISTYHELRELLDLISSEDSVYTSIFDYLSDSDNMYELRKLITEIIGNSELQLEGLSCDRKGMCEGFEYDEVYPNSIEVFDINLVSIDEISDTDVFVTLTCNIKIVADCFYTDYENSYWDQESEEYLYLSKGENIETHLTKSLVDATFKLVEKNGMLKLEYSDLDINLELNPDTRIELLEIDDAKEKALDMESELADHLESFHTLSK